MRSGLVKKKKKKKYKDGEKKRAIHTYTNEILVFEREKKKKTFVREEAGMSFSLSPFPTSLAQKPHIGLATFNTRWVVVSNLHTVHN